MGSRNVEAEATMSRVPRLGGWAEASRELRAAKQAWASSGCSPLRMRSRGPVQKAWMLSAEAASSSVASRRPVASSALSSRSTSSTKD